MSTRHPNNLVNVMHSLGYSLSDMLPAFPGKDVNYLEEMLRDNASALERPVIQYGLLGILESKSRYFNIAYPGYRVHSTQHVWPPAQNAQKKIFFFGGSTAVGFNVEDRDTVPAYLERSLHAQDIPCAVYNFGGGGYTSRQEALRLLQLVDQGHVPDVAIFLDGLNDCYYAYGNYALVNTLDDLYRTEKQRRRMSLLGGTLSYAVSSYENRRRPLPSSQTYCPEKDNPELEEHLSKGQIDKALGNSARTFEKSEVPDFWATVGKRAWEAYLTSVAIIRGIAERFGIKVIFAWQPIAYFRTSAEKRVMEKLYYFYRHEVLGYYAYQWLHAHNWPSMSTQADFLNLSALPETLNGKLYVDMAHYSPAFCEVIGARLAQELKGQL